MIKLTPHLIRISVLTFLLAGVVYTRIAEGQVNAFLAFGGLFACIFIAMETGTMIVDYKKAKNRRLYTYKLRK